MPSRQEPQGNEPPLHETVSAYANRFQGKRDQTDVTEEQRRLRLQTAVKGSEQYVSCPSLLVVSSL